LEHEWWCFSSIIQNFKAIAEWTLCMIYTSVQECLLADLDNDISCINLGMSVTSSKSQVDQQIDQEVIYILSFSISGSSRKSNSWLTAIVEVDICTWMRISQLCGRIVQWNNQFIFNCNE
jgi:hypothetical protein